MRANQVIRNAAKEHDVHLWEIAEEMKVSESYFSRTLRRELPEHQTKACLDAIKAIATRKTKVGKK